MNIRADPTAGSIMAKQSSSRGWSVKGLSMGYTRSKIQVSREYISCSRWSEAKLPSKKQIAQHQQQNVDDGHQCCCGEEGNYAA